MPEPRLSTAYWIPQLAGNNQPITVCDRRTGQFFTYTIMVDSSISLTHLLTHPGARIVARNVNVEDLVYFGTVQGPITPRAFEAAVNILSDDEYGRVLDAKGEYDDAHRPKSRLRAASNAPGQ